MIMVKRVPLPNKRQIEVVTPGQNVCRLLSLSSGKPHDYILRSPTLH